MHNRTNGNTANNVQLVASDVLSRGTENHVFVVKLISRQEMFPVQALQHYSKISQFKFRWSYERKKQIKMSNLRDERLTI
jgi:hypothetical protein